MTFRHQRGPEYYYLHMKQHQFMIDYLGTKRRVRVLLPKDYQKDLDRHYPVLYMHDGQNVFYSKEAYVGHSWKLIPAIKRNPQLPRFITVAIDNANSQRLDEYSPWPSALQTDNPLTQTGGLGDQYSEWFINELIPFIQEHYRVSSKVEDTMLAGSSMGGIITAYLGAKHPEVFGVLGVFSLASWFNEAEFLAFVNASPFDPNCKIYIQLGTQEGDATDALFLNQKMNQAYIDCSLNYYQSLLAKGHPLEKIWLRILADEEHHERYWAKHFPEFLKFALTSSK